MLTVIILDKREPPSARLCGAGKWRKYIFVFAPYITDRQEQQCVCASQTAQCYRCAASHAAKDDIRNCMFPAVTPVHRATVQEQVLRRMSAFVTQDKDGLVTGVKNWNLYHACAKELKVWPDTNCCETFPSMIFFNRAETASYIREINKEG